MTANKLYSKIANIQAQIKGIKRTKENKFQGYKYFTEEQAIILLKPLLEKEKLAMTPSDTDIFFYDKLETKNKKGEPTTEHIIRYLKKVVISDGENEPIIVKIWAMGQDGDISKAKGKAETYGMKYFLSKFWQIPVVDTLDPDQEGKKTEAEPTTATENAETAEEIAARHKDKETADEFLKRHGFNNENKK